MQVRTSLDYVVLRNDLRDNICRATDPVARRLANDALIRANRAYVDGRLGDALGWLDNAAGDIWGKA